MDSLGPVTRATMRKMEAEAFGRGVSAEALMEAAGEGVVRAIAEHWPDWSPTRAVVLCGPGNNGGDGFVIARLLAQQGWEVRLHLMGDAERLPQPARSAHDRWAEIGEVRPLAPDEPVDDDRSLEDSLYSTSCPRVLVVDALFGIGMDRGCEDLVFILRDICDEDDLSFHVVSIDIPSGLDADTGHVLPTEEPSRARAVRADLTVALGAAKLGHYLAAGPEHCGTLKIVPLPGLRAADWPDVLLSPPLRPGAMAKRHGHKYDYGHALILAGGTGRGGAARLAARAALRIGAGLVTLAPPASALSENARAPDALMLAAVDTPDDLCRLVKDRRVTALCIGPGLGIERARALVPAALGLDCPVVVDADALTAYRDDPERLLGMLGPRHILTPHDGEMARLFPDLAAAVAEGTMPKTTAAKTAAHRAGCRLLWKGHDTVIIEDASIRLLALSYENAAPWLATAGSGDVLAGMICGAQARDRWIFLRQVAALHAAAARRFGPGLIADDLPDLIPAVLRDLDA